LTRRWWAAWGRIPRAGRICFAIAFLNAAIWSVVVPPFQVPDEISHFGYAQYLAETGEPPPQGSGSQYSPQEQVALDRLYFGGVVGYPQMRGILTADEERALGAALGRHPSPVGGGGASSATNQPPLYYALEAVPYWISPSHDILARLVLMRLLSALLSAGTVLVVYLFLRELFPRTPWASTVGALMVAFQPMFNFIAAGVQGDNLLYLTSALSFLLLLRAYRRGLTRRRAVAIGATVAAGSLAKLTFVALLPGIGLAILLIVWRELPEGRRRATQMLALTVAVAVVPVALYAVLNVTVWHRGSAAAGGLTIATARGVPGGGSITLRETIDYIWQAYLPRLPFMHHRFFSGGYPLWNVWLNGSIGRFGWLDYGFPSWVYTFGRYLLFVFVALAVIGVYRLRDRIRQVLPLFACFAVTVLGLLASIGYAGVRYWLTTGFRFEQARYLFPLLALYGVFGVLIAFGAGRRWAPAVGAALVLLAMAHGLFAEMLTISRYYG
jgi:4-amino-4-deoxy-L-arabinose transferase-like glycosyltransferase